MNDNLVVCLNKADPHQLVDGCERPYPAWMWAEGRSTCEHAAYTVPDFPGVMTCRCLICGRCGKHTGNATQGHFWSWCRVTHGIRRPHFCCPNDCELEAVDGQVHRF